MLYMDRGGRGLSKGRLDGEIGEIDGGSTTFLAGSIAKFWSTSRQLARLIG